MSNRIQHIAVIRLSAMGDVAMTVPVLLALVRQYPKVRLIVVSRPFFKPIFQAIPNVTFHSVHTHHQHKGFLGLFRLYRELKSQNIDAIADLHNVLRSKVLRLLFSLVGKKVAFTDKGRKEKKALTSLTNKDFRPLKTMVERHVETFAKLGYQINLNTAVHLEKQTLSKEIENKIGAKKHKWIGIAPFAHYESKTYPFDLMQQVVQELSKNPTIKVLLFGGGKREKALLDGLSQGLDNVLNLAKTISFEEELQLISNLDLMVSMDSGNAHLAAMYGIKTITLWGATHPYAGFAPYGQPMENCLVADRMQYPLLPTSVYGNKKVAGYEDAMRTIAVSDIIQKINSNLA